MNLAHCTELLGFNVNVRLAHWRAPTQTNEHKAMGDLYETMAGLIDDLAEVAMGKQGERNFPDQETVLVEQHEPAALVAAGLGLMAEIRKELAPGADDDLLNIVADMSAILNRTQYLLQTV